MLLLLLLMSFAGTCVSSYACHNSESLGFMGFPLFLFGVLIAIGCLACTLIPRERK